MRTAIAIFALLVGLVFTTPAFGQKGPPSPDTALPSSDAGWSSVAESIKPSEVGALNPLRMLDSAANALPGRQGASSGSTSGDSSKGGLSAAINILVVLTVIGLVPSIMLMCTCFVRILIVLGLLRQALGTQSIPPPQVITALALFMTMLVMSPTISRINTEAVEPFRAGEVRDYDDLWNRAKQPVRDFMFAQIEATGNWSSLYMVLNHRGVDTSAPENLKRSDVDMVSLVPAYMLSELKTAFMMGFKVYLPFLVIDMVVSTMLISMSMMMVPPVMVSLPFKLLLFVLVDGWTLVVGGLMSSFAQPTAEIASLTTTVLHSGVHECVVAHMPVVREFLLSGVRAG